MARKPKLVVQPTGAPTRKVAMGFGLGAAPSGIMAAPLLAWLYKESTGSDMPSEIAAGFGGLVSTVVGFAVAYMSRNAERDT